MRAAFFSRVMPPDEWAEYMIREYNALADRCEDALARAVAAERERDEAEETWKFALSASQEALRDEHKRAEAAEARLEAATDALRAEWLAKLPDLDYEVDDPGRPNQTKWAWELHPWFALVGMSHEECVAYIRTRAARAVLAGEGEPERVHTVLDFDKAEVRSEPFSTKGTVGTSTGSGAGPSVLAAGDGQP